MADTNYYYCIECGKITRHIQISARESMANDKDMNNVFGRTLGTLSDLTGITKVFSLFISSWKCCECGKLTDRNPEGKVIHYCGKAKY